ncbi:fatty acid synthase subunit beta, fungi type [Talaromyces islandicus]|uniref:Fatty acid synthase subunit beta, fungi type n=1 Tax=Talaromyces islandicus TaxID=28573 RepID=A0A0U1LXZ7_TALIS|nr:fatty acid synthase subunit beta, fungi type [Talaromyces islandicus]
MSFDYVWTPTSNETVCSLDHPGFSLDSPLTDYDDRYFGIRRSPSSEISKIDVELLAFLESETSTTAKFERLSSYMQDILQKSRPSRMDDNWGILQKCLDYYNRSLLCQEDIHTVVSSLELDLEKKLDIIHTYYEASSLVDSHSGTPGSSLLSDASSHKAKIICVFGGQGVETYLDELQQKYNTYQPLLQPLIITLSDHLQMLASDVRIKDMYPHGLDIRTWLEHPELTPDSDYLLSAPVSMPLIGLAQVVNYFIMCKVLDMSPGDFRNHLAGAAGHSQGIVVAALLGTASSWVSFDKAIRTALTVLFWIGCRSQQHFPESSISPNLRIQSEKLSPMLSVKGLSLKMLEDHLLVLNNHLPSSKKVHIALVNGPRQFVVAGWPPSLFAIKTNLSSGEVSSAQGISRVPYSHRKPVVHTRFLSSTVPFHTPLLEIASQQVQEDLGNLTVNGHDIPFPIFSTDTNVDLRENDNIIISLVRMVTVERVNWEGALKFPKITHVIDLGPGKEHGMGSIVNTLKAGTGVRTILANILQGPSKTLGYTPELYSSKEEAIYPDTWGEKFAPRLVRTAGGRITVDTKFSRLTGLPPVMVAGMTPTTCSWGFVSEVMKAGFHIEFATGGYHNAESMKEALSKLLTAIPAGRGIACNVIYANPRAMSWQIPLLVELRQSGFPIEGLTIGAGVPSIDIANGYIRDLSLRYISFKPGSKDAIDAVMRIAEANPAFPIILQWTGGRAGGHHSFEDFHDPILEKYGQIRSHSNIILMAGSGFGGPDDTYPYLTGTWSQQFGHPPMPFDGILLGSRVMAAKEAPTSPAAKHAIANAPGIHDNMWEGTYQRSTGGVISVKSEMGERIHKLATRGVLFWAELDKNIFSLPSAKKLVELEKQKDYIISRLNADFQKVWFGQTSTGKPVDVQQMTYSEILQRLVDLLYPKNTETWIDLSYKKFTRDFVRIVEETFGSLTREIAVLRHIDQLDKPYQLLDDIVRSYPDTVHTIITAHDANSLLQLYRRPGQKPLPFILALDETFEYWFKKDSLWQSESIESVIDQDVGRVCILHGPVAAQYTKVVDEPVRHILGEIHDSHINGILKEHYAGDYSKISDISHLYNDCNSFKDGSKIPGLFMQRYNEPPMLIFRLEDSGGPLPQTEEWTHMLGGQTPSWRQALLTLDKIVQGKMQVSNPVKQMFTPRPGLTVQIIHPDAPKETVIILKQVPRKGSWDTASTEIRSLSTTEITVTLREPPVARRELESLTFHFGFKVEPGMNPIQEIMDDRNSRITEFYRRIWINPDSQSGYNDDDTQSDKFLVTSNDIREFSKSIENKNAVYHWRPEKPLYAPLDFAIVIAWKSLMKCLFSNNIDGDLLKLLHLGNHFEVLDNTSCIYEGDVLFTTAETKSIKIKKDSGKIIEVHAIIHRHQKPIILVKSEFIIQGRYTDYGNTFEIREEKPLQIPLTTAKDVAVLQSRNWMRCNPGIDLKKFMGRNLVFRLQSRYTFRDSTFFDGIQTTGEVTAVFENVKIAIGSVHLKSTEYGRNPVIDFLERHSTAFERVDRYDTPRPLCEDIQVKMPISSEPYARASADFNPIHVSDAFGRYAGHDGRVIHGMYTSGLVRGLVELYVAENDPERVQSWSCVFKGKVRPGDNLQISISHAGMDDGRMLISATARNAATGAEVLSATANVAQKRTAYVFTGQGSQDAGMGMELYENSEAARHVWETADQYYLKTYGFSIIDIVRRNPRELTIFFGGKRGKSIRENYMSLVFDVVDSHGNLATVKAFPEITNTTRSYTYRSESGLLHETIFTQPAMAFTELGRVHEMRSRGVIDRSSCFAGHSLGEFIALGGLGELFTLEGLAALTFYRGLTMQKAVRQEGRAAIEYSMCAVNPARLSPGFKEADLSLVVAAVARETGGLCEIVNYNIENMQYVCAGETRCLDCLAGVLDELATHPIAFEVSDFTSSNTRSDLQTIIHSSLAHTTAKPQPLILKRSKATIPLKVNVPFHSSLLRPGVDSFRRILERSIPSHMVNPELLIGKYIPNLTAKRFELSKTYCADILTLTKSSRMREILENWEELVAVA